MSPATSGLLRNAGCGVNLPIWTCPSHELYDKIVRQRIMNKHHLRLCNEIFLHQTIHRRHAHLEQPSESIMLDQPELSDFREGTLHSAFDMCRVGKLKMPSENAYLRKRTSVHTSCGYLGFHLNEKSFVQGNMNTTLPKGPWSTEGIG